MFHISHDFFVIVLAGLRNCCTFASHLRGMPAEKQKNAAIAQLVERNLAKVEVAGSNPVCRSFYWNKKSLESLGGGMVDALVSGTSDSNVVQVRVLFWALPMLIIKKSIWRGGGIGRRATLRG